MFEDIKDILSSDELHLIHLLLDNVKIAVKLENDLGDLFDSLIGSPQGDAASALFFIIYLAKTLKQANESLANKNSYIPDECTNANIPFLLDQQYADGHQQMIKF